MVQEFDLAHPREGCILGVPGWDPPQDGHPEAIGHHFISTFARRKFWATESQKSGAGGRGSPRVCFPGEPQETHQDIKDSRIQPQETHQDIDGPGI